MFDVRLVRCSVLSLLGCVRSNRADEQMSPYSEAHFASWLLGDACRHLDETLQPTRWKVMEFRRVLMVNRQF